MQNEEPSLAGNLSLGYRSRKLDDIPSPSRALPGNSVFGVIEFWLGYQLPSGINKAVPCSLLLVWTSTFVRKLFGRRGKWQCIMISGLVPFAHHGNLTPTSNKHLQSKKCCVVLLSFIHLKIPMHFLLSSFYRWGNRDTERQTIFLKLTMLGRDSARAPKPISWFHPLI